MVSSTTAGSRSEADRAESPLALPMHSQCEMDCSAAERDPLDFSPRFLFRGPSGFVYASRVGSLLRAGAPSELDDDAVALFLRLGFFVGSDTPFRAIRAAIAPIPTAPKPHALTRAQVIEDFLARFRVAVRRRLPSGPYVLPLSGGRDSRHILLELIDSGCVPDACVTVEHPPPRGNSDARIAQELCARLGVPHRVLPARVDRLAAEEEKNSATSYCTGEHVQFMPLARYLAATTSETHDGIAGDVLSQSRYLDADLLARLRKGHLDAAADFLLDGFGKHGIERALGWTLSEHAQQRFSRERAHARLVRELQCHANAPNPIGSFFFWNRTRRAIALAPFSLFAPVKVHAPFLDRDVFECLAATPAEALLDRRLHTDAIAHRWRSIATVPYACADTELTRASYHRIIAAGLVRRLARSRSELLHAPAILARCAASVVDGCGARIWFVARVMWLWQIERIAAGRDAA